ncbi:hypothetical protein ES703_94718 [subsurface metagenome]
MPQDTIELIEDEATPTYRHVAGCCNGEWIVPGSRGKLHGHSIACTHLETKVYRGSLILYQLYGILRHRKIRCSIKGCLKCSKLLAFY